MPDRPPSTPAPLRTTGGLVPRSNHHAPTDDTSNDPRHHSFGSLSGARANPMAALQAMPRAPSSARLNSDSHAPLVLSSTTTVVYSPAVGRVGIPPQDPGSPTRQRIFELPSSGFPSFTETHGARIEAIPKAGRNPIGRGFWAQPQLPSPTTASIKPMSFPKAAGDLQRYRPESVSRQIENAPPVPNDAPSRLPHNDTSMKQTEENVQNRSRQSPFPTVPTNDQPDRPRSKTPNDRQPQNAPDSATVPPHNPHKRKPVDNDASRVETFDDIRASSPLAGVGHARTPLVPKPPPKAPVKTGHFDNKFSKSLGPFVNHAALWKQTIDQVSKDERVYTIDHLDELRVGLDSAVTKMMGNVHAASQTHNQLKEIGAETLDERKRKTKLYEQETARRKETASTVASSQVRKKVKYY